MIKVLVAAHAPQNLYFQEVYSQFASGGYEVTYAKGFPENGVQGYDIVHVHWPEALVQWQSPSDEALERVRSQLARAPIVICTRHNYAPHRVNNKQTEKLYRLVYERANGVIHLGKHSLEEYKATFADIFDKQLHAVIPHPVYTLYPNNVSRDQARKSLGLSEKDKVVLVFGTIRHPEEKNFFMEVFRKLKYPNKTLLVSRQLSPRYFEANIKGKYKLRTLESFLRKKLFRQHFFYQDIPNEKVQLFLNAADVLFLSRSDVLNSGVPFLGWSFEKVVVAPECGNITEVMTTVANPSYQPQNVESAVDALKKGLELAEKGEGSRSWDVAQQAFHPHKVSDMTMSFLRRLVR